MSRDSGVAPDRRVRAARPLGLVRRRRLGPSLVPPALLFPSGG